MADLIGRHYFLSGKVQGVWFRASTKEQADLLGVTGWVRNLSDGRVEVLAYGEKDAALSLLYRVRRDVLSREDLVQVVPRASFERRPHWTSIWKASAGAECVIWPTEIRSTPV